MVEGEGVSRDGVVNVAPKSLGSRCSTTPAAWKMEGAWYFHWEARSWDAPLPTALQHSTEDLFVVLG